jgi:hypothetical protein
MKGFQTELAVAINEGTAFLAIPSKHILATPAAESELVQALGGGLLLLTSIVNNCIVQTLAWDRFFYPDTDQGSFKPVVVQIKLALPADLDLAKP